MMKSAKENIPLLFLCGMMGTGKSAVGRELATLLKRPFYDLDKLIEKREGLSLPELFEKKGEAYFRKAEHDVLMNFITKNNGVLALGGGTLQNQQITDKVKSSGLLIYINTALPVLIERLQRNDRRPLIRGLSARQLEEKIVQLSAEREIFYKQAHISVGGSSNPAAYTAGTILSEIDNLTSE
ncbi:MAG: shikimate kinase [Balneolaceae bacterium]|nr:MAG: shikimate kinase [Balneolaceae bacterium]